MSSRFILVSPYMAEAVSGIGTYHSGLHTATEPHVWVSTLLSSSRSKDKSTLYAVHQIQDQHITMIRAWFYYVLFRKCIHDVPCCVGSTPHRHISSING